MTPDRCEKCGAMLVRNPEQPRICAACTPTSPAEHALRRALAALHAKRGTLSLQPAVRLAVSR
jgi:hypothetical protein